MKRKNQPLLETFKRIGGKLPITEVKREDIYDPFYQDDKETFSAGYRLGDVILGTVYHILEWSAYPEKHIKKLVSLLKSRYKIDIKILTDMTKMQDLGNLEKLDEPAYNKLRATTQEAIRKYFKDNSFSDEDQPVIDSDEDSWAERLWNDINFIKIV
jgi:hypothetical protein